jgi:hypothetical protein
MLLPNWFLEILGRVKSPKGYVRYGLGQALVFLGFDFVVKAINGFSSKEFIF